MRNRSPRKPDSTPPALVLTGTTIATGTPREVRLTEADLVAWLSALDRAALEAERAAARVEQK